MSLTTGLSRLKIVVIDQDTNQEKAVVQYNDLNYQYLVQIEEVLMNALVQLGKDVAKIKK